MNKEIQMNTDKLVSLANFCFAGILLALTSCAITTIIAASAWIFAAILK
jgi:hypothetical protein